MTDTAAWHYDNARALLDTAQQLEQSARNVGAEPNPEIATVLAAAAVHATLAVACTTREQTIVTMRQTVANVTGYLGDDDTPVPLGGAS